MLWKMMIENSIKGANLAEIDANVLIFNNRQNYLLVEGGFPAVFDKLHKHCKTQIRFNTRVLSVDYTGKYIRVHTTNGLYSAKKLISSLPLGLLKTNKVKFNPQIPQSHR
jgi:monoamine oxidase